MTVTIWASVVSGCATVGALDARGYANKTYPYRIDYHDVASKQLLRAEWQLDNWSFNTGLNTWELKDGDDYVAVRSMDLNRDGTVSIGEKVEEAIFDVKLVSRATGAVIWAKAHPIHPDDASRKLDVILENYADSLRGNGLYSQGSLFSVERLMSRRFTTFMSERSEGSLSGSPMIAATIELAEVDRLQIRPDERSGKLRVVIVKYPYLVAAMEANPFQRVCIGESTNSNASQAPSIQPRTDARSAGVFSSPDKPLRCHALLVIGYYNSPDHFAEELPAFEQILKQVSITAAPEKTAASAETQGATQLLGTPKPAVSADSESPTTPSGPAP